MLVFENDGKIYAPIKEIASYLGYESYNGEYSQRSEEQSKCYIQNENEIANFSLGSNTIYKLDLTIDGADYQNIYVDDPVIAKSGVLYATSEAIEEAFNVSFQYDKNANRIYIYTLPYLVQAWSSNVLDYGYTGISEVFANQKAILKDMLVVSKEGNNNYFAVIDVNNKTILEPKYDNITYLPETGDFKVEVDGKVGILGNKGETKIQISYDDIELMDRDKGLYVASNGGKYGVIDTRGNVKIYIENDEVGMDISPFSQNDIKNKYILAGNLIPVRKGELWGLYDLTGKQVVDFTYNSFGYIARSNKDAINLLVIPDYEVLVACKDEKYTLLNSVGQQLFGGPVADDIYMTISGGQKHYYITANNQTMDAEVYLDNIGVRKQSEGGNSNISSNTQTNNTNTNNTNTSTNNNEQNTSVNNNNNNNSDGITNNGEEQMSGNENIEEQPVENNDNQGSGEGNQGGEFVEETSEQNGEE